MIEPGNFLAGTSLFNDKIINASANEMWKFMSEEVRTVEGREIELTGGKVASLGRVWNRVFLV